MRADDRVESLDGLADVAVAVVVHCSLGKPRVRGLLVVEELAESWGERVIGGSRRQIQSITARLRSVNVKKDGSAHSVAKIVGLDTSEINISLNIKVLGNWDIYM